MTEPTAIQIQFDLQDIHNLLVGAKVGLAHLPDDAAVHVSQSIVRIRKALTNPPAPKEQPSV